jgi:hypothetical protein
MVSATPRERKVNTFLWFYFGFLHAQGELEWLQATLATLQEGRCLTLAVAVIAAHK